MSRLPASFAAIVRIGNGESHPAPTAHIRSMIMLWQQPGEQGPQVVAMLHTLLGIIDPSEQFLAELIGQLTEDLMAEPRFDTLQHHAPLPAAGLMNRQHPFELAR